MKSYNDFNNIIRDMNILYIPIVSCINRQTNEYDLSCDGNINRFITTFSKCKNFKSLTIILPSHKKKNSDKLILNWTKEYNNINLKYSPYFGIHAGEQRKGQSIISNMKIWIDNNININNIDLIIFESQYLGKTLIESYNNKQYIFWNPVSKVIGKTRIFLEGYDKINDWLINKCDYMIIASPDQIKYYSKYDNKLLYLDILIDRNVGVFNKYTKIKPDGVYLDKYKIIYYLPFRLTDEGYKINNVLDIINNTKDDYIVLYTDPNNSKVFENKDNTKFLKISSDRDTYYTLLSYDNVIIPYFEDLDFINHAAIHEFMNEQSKCTILVDSNLGNPYNINNCKRIKRIKL